MQKRRTNNIPTYTNFPARIINIMHCLFPDFSISQLFSIHRTTRFYSFLATRDIPHNKNKILSFRQLIPVASSTFSKRFFPPANNNKTFRKNSLDLRFFQIWWKIIRRGQIFALNNNNNNKKKEIRKRNITRINLLTHTHIFIYIYIGKVS